MAKYVAFVTVRSSASFSDLTPDKNLRKNAFSQKINCVCFNCFVPDEFSTTVLYCDASSSCTLNNAHKNI